MKELWNDFKKWVHYVLEYKDNTEYIEIKEGEVSEKDKEIENLKKKLKETKQ